MGIALTEASNQKSKYAYRKILFYKKSTVYSIVNKEGVGGYHPPPGTSAISGVIFYGVGYQYNLCHKMCTDEYPTATEKVKIIFDMHQSHDAEERRGWVATTHPLVADPWDTELFVTLATKWWVVVTTHP